MNRANDAVLNISPQLKFASKMICWPVWWLIAVMSEIPWGDGEWSRAGFLYLPILSSPPVADKLVIDRDDQATAKNSSHMR